MTEINKMIIFTPVKAGDSEAPEVAWNIKFLVK